MSSQSFRALVLVLDDDGPAAGALGLLLSDWGYECVHRTRLDEALKDLEGRFDAVRAIIADSRLGDGRRGAEAIGELRKVGIDVPALVLTGALTGRDRRPAADYRIMEKPVAPARLKAWLHQAVASRKT